MDYWSEPLVITGVLIRGRQEMRAERDGDGMMKAEVKEGVAGEAGGERGTERF